MNSLSVATVEAVAVRAPLTDLESKTLTAWRGVDPDCGYLSFDQAANRSGIERSRIRRFVRALARKGMLQYGRGLWSVDGDMRGSGYGLTKLGHDIVASLPDNGTAERGDA